MAGAFGYEKGDHYDVSIACGERALLPAVRDADDQTLIIADGFSCREQISQESDRHALHLAEAIQFAKGGGDQKRPEGRMLASRRKEFVRAGVRAAAITIGAVALSAWLFSNRSSKRIKGTHHG
jgi:hypothetical protein